MSSTIKKGGLRVIVPTPITDAVLYASSVLENDYAIWNPLTSYTVGALVIRIETHRVYENLIAGVNATLPEVAALEAVPRWLEVSPTNRWGMFDRKVGTKTLTASPLSVVLRAGRVQGVYLDGLQGAEATISLTSSPGGPVVNTRTVTLDGRIITSVYDWFYTEYEQKERLSVTDLPLHYNGDLTIAITGTGSVACGMCQVGRVLEIGGTEFGAKWGMSDYSVKQKDRFGNLDVQEGDYSDNVTLSVVVLKEDFDRVINQLKKLRAIACGWIGTTTSGYDNLSPFGYFKDAYVVAENSVFCKLAIEIEGVV